MDYGIENCSFTLSIPEYGSEAMEIVSIGFATDVWSLAGDAKVDSQRPSYRFLPHHVDEVSSFMSKYNAMEHLQSFSCQ